ncbi:MAG: nucleotidyl transferase AbiEii/AbiGii toxin family protein [Patescibacteria group bacterium]
MDSSAKEQLGFHWDVVPKSTKKALDFLSTQKWLSHFGWYLAGGTALALQTSHRTSVDLDFFTSGAIFESTEVTGHFKENKNWEISSDRPSTIYGKLFQAKVSFIAYPFFVPKQDFLQYGFVRILQPIDIAVMKVIAVSQRGRKRDFFDLYWCAHNIEPLEQIIARLRQQYPSVAHDHHHIIKSLAYFEDAESDPPLVLHFDASWDQVKQFFTEEIEKIAFKYV